jgi:hypothetical protein
MPIRRGALSRAGLASAAVMAAAGCASAPRPRTAADMERPCIDRRDINTIRALDERHVLVKLSADRFFMLTVDDTCQALEQARAISIMDATSRVCAGGSTLLTFTDPVLGPMRCRVELLDPVANRAAAMDLIESRREP